MTPFSAPPRPRLVVLISGRGSNLQAIGRAIGRGELAADIVAVVSNRAAAAGLDWARAHGIATDVLDHTGFADRDAFDDALARRVAAHRPDWIVLAGFMRILTDRFIDRFAGRIVNIHPSLLPAFQGLDTHARALCAGVAVHGATVHHVVRDLDAGAPIAQGVVPVLPDDDAPRLAARVLAIEHRLYPHALALLFAGTQGAVGVRGAGAGIDDGAGGAAGVRVLLDPLLCGPVGSEGRTVGPDPA